MNWNSLMGPQVKFLMKGQRKALYRNKNIGYYIHATRVFWWSACYIIIACLYLSKNFNISQWYFILLAYVLLYYIRMSRDIHSLAIIYILLLLNQDTIVTVVIEHYVAHWYLFQTTSLVKVLWPVQLWP